MPINTTENKLISSLFSIFTKNNILTTEQTVINIFTGKRESNNDNEYKKKSFHRGMSFAKLLKNNISLNKKFSKGTQDFFEKNRVNGIKDLFEGTSFGELALLTKKPRAATIVCKTDCHFAIFDKEHFDTILSKFLKIFL